MQILYINAAFRAGSRTARLAADYLRRCTGTVTEIDLGTQAPAPLDAETLRRYEKAVATGCFDDPMFDPAKQFAAADEIVIAAPFWNYSIPAVLHNYLELVCTQGITFDLSPEGRYYGKCRARKLTFLTTAGGPIPKEDHAFGYIKNLAEAFWEIPEIRCYGADCLDITGANVEAILEKTISEMK